jgi:hypothetical protein
MFGCVSMRLNIGDYLFPKGKQECPLIGVNAGLNE